MLDDFVAERVMQVLAPASLELSLAAEQALRAERAQPRGIGSNGWSEPLRGGAGGASVCGRGAGKSAW